MLTHFMESFTCRWHQMKLVVFIFWGAFYVSYISLYQSVGLTNRQIDTVIPRGTPPVCLKKTSCGRNGFTDDIWSKCWTLFYSNIQGGLQHLRLESCSKPRRSTTRIQIQIDQLDPIIHFCCGGNKWPSSCLMSMMIISAICQGVSKHLL